MPYALPVPSSGLQALILCGPGLSLNTFTSNPEEFPKALIPIANRPMVWYPLDFCYRSGITKIHLVSPPSSAKTIEVALLQNPHLTSLPLPRADVLSPPNLSQTSGTAEILRLPEVQVVIQGDFLVLPCDLICEIPGESFVETWMIQQATPVDFSALAKTNYPGLMLGQESEDTFLKGGLGVWYQTKSDDSAKGEETDFIVTASLRPPAVRPPPGSLRPMLSSLVYSTTADSLKDLTDDKGSFQIRHSILHNHGRIRVFNTYRDAHIYIFPYWVLEMVKLNPSMDSISEDIVGWWAKAGWQRGLCEKLKLDKILRFSDQSIHESEAMDENVNGDKAMNAQSNILDARMEGDDLLSSRNFAVVEVTADQKAEKLQVPSILAYIHPSNPQAPLICRVDTTALLLYVSLRLAKLESIEETGKIASSPFAHAHKISHQAGIAQRCTITRADCLLAENVTVEEKSVIKESVIGYNCHIKSGARLTRCVLMDGVVVGEKSQLTNCILGRKAVIGKESTLKECEVQDGNKVPDETDAKGEKFMIFEGLDDEEDFASTNEVPTD